MIAAKDAATAAANVESNDAAHNAANCSDLEAALAGQFEKWLEIQQVKGTQMFIR